MRFMVAVRLEIPPERREELPALRNAEDAHVAAQTREGNLLALYFASDAPTLWAVVNAESLEAARRQVEAYPFYPFMRVTYTPLR